MGRTLTHSGEHGKLYLIRDLRPDGDNAFVGRLVAGLWCAVPPRFQDFDEDPTGWGHTQEEAVQNLVGSARFRTKAAQEGWNNNPVATDFTVLDESAELPYGPDLLPEQKKGL
jgi:hypothetical protein